MELAALQVKAGDTVPIMLGAPVPHVSQPLSNGNFKLVGECYIHGVMDGEALDHLVVEGHRCRPRVKGKSDALYEELSLNRLTTSISNPNLE